MAFTHAAGKHRRTSRLGRGTARMAGAAALATTGVVGTLAAPALAAQPSAGQSGILPIITLGNALADQVDAQAAAQRQAADEEHAEAVARERAAARAKKAHTAKVHAARAAERERLTTYVLPVTGSYISTGYRTGGSLWSSGAHTGVDFHAASGTAVHAVGSGTVVTTGWGGAYGNQVVIRMSDGMYTQYGHLSSIGVSVGRRVTPGDRIGLSGATGNATGPHLHFEARTTAEYGSDVDPVSYLRSHGLDV